MLSKKILLRRILPALLITSIALTFFTRSPLSYLFAANLQLGDAAPVFRFGVADLLAAHAIGGIKVV